MSSARKVAVDVVLDIALLDELDQVAVKEKTSRSDMIRRLCRRALEAS